MIVSQDPGFGITAVKLDIRHIPVSKYEMLDRVLRKTLPTGNKIRQRMLARYKESMGDTRPERPPAFTLFSPEDKNKINLSLGTLNGENSFIEISMDKEKMHYWLIVCSGSGMMGRAVRNNYINKPSSESNNRMYRMDTIFCRKFAKRNRELVILEVMDVLDIKPQYISDKIEVSRDDIVDDSMGLVEKNKLTIIPLNILEGCLICKGGAENIITKIRLEKIYSDEEAYGKLSLDEYKHVTRGIQTSSVNENTLNCAPSAYESVPLFIKELSQNVEILDKTVPMYVFKDKDKKQEEEEEEEE